MPDVIKRSVSFELTRATEDGRTLEGYAAVFGVPQQIRDIHGEYVETIKRGAFAKSIAERGSHVVMMYDHGRHPMFGALPIARIETLREDERGLFVRARLVDSWLVDPVRDAIRDGAVRGMSFVASVVDSKSVWSRDRSQVTHTELALLELGPTGLPAYDATSVAVRMAEVAGLSLTPEGDSAQAVAVTEVSEPPADAEHSGAPPEPPADAEHSAIPSAAATTDEETPVADTAEGTVERTLTLAEAQDKLAEAQAEIARVADKDTITDADDTYLERMAAEAEELGQFIRRERAQARRTRVNSMIERGYVSDTLERVSTVAPRRELHARDPLTDPRDVTVSRAGSPWDFSTVRSFGWGPDQWNAEYVARAKSIVDFDDTATDEVKAAMAAFMKRSTDRPGKAAQQALALSDPLYVSAFAKLVTRGNMALLTPEENEAYTRAASTTDNAGGFMIPFQLDPSVIITSAGVYSEIRAVARQVVATGDVWNGVSAGAVSWSGDAEAAQVSDDTPTFAQPAIAIHKPQASIPFSIEFGMDAANATAELSRLLAQGREDYEAAAFVTGNGTNNPIGIITALTGGPRVFASNGAGSLGGAAADTLYLDQIRRLSGLVAARYRRRGAYAANYLTFSALKAQDTSNSAFQDPTTDGIPPRLYGRPAIEAEAITGTITGGADNLVAIFGDWDNYVIADRLGMTVELMQHVPGANGRPTGQRAWYAYYRVGADSVNDTAFAVLNVT